MKQDNRMDNRRGRRDRPKTSNPQWLRRLLNNYALLHLLFHNNLASPNANPMHDI
jgi:hypothetical protein